MHKYVNSVEDIRLKHDSPPAGSPLAGRSLAVSCHMERWLVAERLLPLFASFGHIWVVNEHRYTDRRLADAFHEREIDTFIVGEYASHWNMRSRVLRQAGIRVYHYGLGIISHYDTSRFDWGMYDDDTWLRWATSPEQLPSEPAVDTGEQVERVLIIGQVPGDQALQYGGRGYTMAQLVREVRMVLPRAELWYRPHPRTLERVGIPHSLPDSYLLDPDDKIPVLVPDRFTDAETMAAIRARYPRAQLTAGGSLGDSLAQVDAAAMVNSTACYECVQAGVTAYIAGVPLIDLHQGGMALLGNITQGRHLPSTDYRDKLRAQLLSMQSQPGQVYGAHEFIAHEQAMQTARNCHGLKWASRDEDANLMLTPELQGVVL